MSNKSNKKILVTGATGFIGSHLCEELLNRGYIIVGISRSVETYKLSNIVNNSNFHLCTCDISKYNEIKKIMHENRFDAIFHMAAHLPHGDNTENDIAPYFESNVKGTLNILQAAYLECISKVIYSSTMNVYGTPQYLPVDEKHPANPENIYGLTKLIGETICRFYAHHCNIKIIILRYSGVFGPKREEGVVSKFIDKALKNQNLTIFSNGSDIWDMVYIKDVINANISALGDIKRLGGGIFNIGIGKGVNIVDLANKIIKLAGSTSKIEFGNEPSSLNFFYDISKAIKLLGFHPQPLDESLKEYIRIKRGDIYEQ